MPKKDYAAVAICYNEERDIDAFLKINSRYVSQIIIVDDGSTDATEKLVNEFKNSNKDVDVVFVKKKRGRGEYFSDQRNFGISLSKRAYTFHLDIDEFISSELYEECCKAEYAGFDAVKYKRRNHFLGFPMYYGNWNSWHRTHFARTDLQFFGDRMHETINYNYKAKIYTTSAFTIHLNESTYEERLRKSTLYTIVEGEKLKEKEKKRSLYMVLFYSIKVFVYQYIFKRGFLDGKLGFVFAIHSAISEFKIGLISNLRDSSRIREKLKDAILFNYQNK